MRRELLAAILAALLALATAGCGATPLSTAALRGHATHICRTALARESRIRTPTSPSQGAAFLRQGVAVLTPELRALRRLDAGGRSAPQLHTAVLALGDELQDMRASARALAGGSDPVQELRTLEQQLTPLEARADAAWHELAIPACAAS